MRRSFVISDWFYRLSHILKRNRVAVIIYSLTALLFLIIGIVVGAHIDDKTDYILRNSTPIFSFLRGDSGVISFLFIDLLITTVYCVFTLSMFFHRAVTFLSLAPCIYRSYVLGMQTCVILAVFSVPAIPFLFVFFVPVSIIEVVVICMLSFKCFRFASNVRCSPSMPDIKEYFRSSVPFFIVIVICTLLKALTAALFGSALIGVI